MRESSFWIYLAILAGTTYLVRAIPFVAIKNKIENKYVQSFLYYIPYAVLSAMTIPAVFYSTDIRLGAVAGAVVAVIFALKKKSLTVVAVAACVMVYVVEYLI